MKIRMSAIRYRGPQQEICDGTITADVTTNIHEVASTLIRAGMGSPSLLPYAMAGTVPLTIKTSTMDGQPPLILDAASPMSESGLQPGDIVEPVLESHPGQGHRLHPPIATIRVIGGQQDGALYLPSAGDNLIGRDQSCRIRLIDREVSRRHAILRSCPNGIEIEDLGSVNGTTIIDGDAEYDGERPAIIRIARTGSAHIAIGTTTLRIESSPPTQAVAASPTVTRYLPSPIVSPTFAPDPVELPSPPPKPKPPRFPLIALAAPLLMGTVMFAVTKSAMSLIFIALSPLIMVGTWLDNFISGKRAQKGARAEYEENLAATRKELEKGLKEEQEHRNKEASRAIDLIHVPTTLDSVLWSKRSEDPSFLCLALGQAMLPARREITLPPRADLPAEQWEKVKALYEAYRNVPQVPLVEQLHSCGNIGITGHESWLMSAARAAVVQLTSLHSPADLVVTAFANETQAHGEWGWLKWLPHADSVYSPLPCPHLVADERSSAALMLALESLINDRRKSHNNRTVRARVSSKTADSDPGPLYSQGVLPAIVVLIFDCENVDISRLVSIAEQGPDVGVHCIWVNPSDQKIPAACRTVVTVDHSSWQVGFVRKGITVPLSSMDSVELSDARIFARAIARVSDVGARVLDESDLPSSVTFDDLVQEDVLGSESAILHRWLETDSITASWKPGQERDDHGLLAVVGQGSDGPVELDLRIHGPHALVGGTTGSGKSEFLQTWIMSLASKYSPDRVTFLLVDYKGGAAFADCVDLPHTVGLVTDLNTHLVRRALTSLRAELRYREELLADKNAKDLLSLELRGDPDTPPALIIIVDEFAALVAEIPEFVDGVIDVAQRGRSLGLHLVLATQRPAGVIKDNLRANTNLRVALRMADDADSSDVIGSKEAAFFSAANPGRAAAKVGAGSLWHFQTAYLGGRRTKATQSSIEIQSLDFGKQTPWPVIPLTYGNKTSPDSEVPRDIESLAASIVRAAKRAQITAPRKPWVPQLENEIPFSCLQAPTAIDHLLVGIVDQPHLQRKSVHGIALTEVGNVVIYGGPGSGKSTALLACAYSAITADPSTNIYGIDAGGNSLRVLSDIPQVGAIIPSGERDRVGRLLAKLKETVDARIQKSGETKQHPIVCLIDGIATFREQYEMVRQSTNPYEDLTHIIRLGRTVGVYVILTCERPNGLPAALASAVPERFTLHLPSDNDYQSLGVPTGVLNEAPPGRSLRIGSDEEIQWAYPGRTSNSDDVQAAFTELADLQQKSSAAEPWTIPPVPTQISRCEVVTQSDDPAAFAITTADLMPVDVPESGFILVSGPARSGRSTAVRSMVAAFSDRAALEGCDVEAFLISPTKSPLAQLRQWTDVADTALARENVIRSLRDRLDDAPTPQQTFVALPPIGATTPPVAEVPAEKPDVAPFPKEGAIPLVVIEDIGGFNGTGNENDLAALMRLLRRHDIPTIIEAENATVNGVWELSSQLRGMRWAIALQPDANDVPSIFTTPFTHYKRTDSPPGRGILILGGNIHGIHVATPES